MGWDYGGGSFGFGAASYASAASFGADLGGLSASTGGYSSALSSDLASLGYGMQSFENSGGSYSGYSSLGYSANNFMCSSATSIMANTPGKGVFTDGQDDAMMALGYFMIGAGFALEPFTFGGSTALVVIGAAIAGTGSGDKAFNH